MSEQDSKKVSWTAFWTILGGVMLVTSIVAGYLFNEISKVQADQISATLANTQIQVQLSQIQTDILWIKQKLGNEK